MMKALLQSSLGRLRHRLKHDRGAVLVEAALCIPLLIVVIFGAVEAGLAWEAKSATVSGVRTGTLRASSDAENPGVDLRVLQSVIAEVGGDNVSRINSIVIFEVTGDAGSAFAGCIGGGTGNCVQYDQTVLSGVAAGTVTLADFDNGSGTSVTDPITGEITDYQCASGFLDSGWCAGERVDDGDVQLGVGINYTHQWFTGILPFGPPTFQEYVTSSTFTDGGVDINPGTPVATPFTGILVNNFNFDQDPNGLFGSNITFTNFEPTDTGITPYSDGLGGPGLGAGTEISTISLSGLDDTAQVCVSYDLYVFGDVEDSGGAQDWFEVDIEGSTSTRVSFDGTGTTPVNTTVAHAQRITHCGPTDGSGNAQIDFIGRISAGDEGWAIDNLTITN